MMPRAGLRVRPVLCDDVYGCILIVYVARRYCFQLIAASADGVADPSAIGELAS